ncbi:hypothetical protein [Kineosporia sp. NBRC 101731]|uniref:hypothetical protein n=1 Tax=Kineosporia sp. NBRC 101731 TaxID=3032199 RepID=UPI0024A5BDE4|nr:hypothetical protein [Kineosporia sp. NBRC 101731]GLY29365.1 hypothetical protein Kisp02_27300 [Kineosporia sp. NBRC 101731]
MATSPPAPHHSRAPTKALDRAFIRDHPDLIERAAQVKGIDIDVQKIITLDADVRSSQHQLDESRAEKKRLSDGFRSATPDQRADLKERSATVQATIDTLTQQPQNLSSSAPPTRTPPGSGTTPSWPRPRTS